MYAAKASVAAKVKATTPMIRGVVSNVRVANVANGLPYLHHHLVPLGRQARAFGLRQTSHRHRFDIYLFVLLFRFLVKLRDVRADFAAAKRKQ